MSDHTRVLIAEDDPVSREIMVRLLERNGYDVVTASDGADAVAMAGPEIDVALVDWMMPGVDGVEVCRHIKSQTRGAGYVIMVTSRTEKSDIVHALESGADDYMTKPVDHAELLARVKAGERIARRERELAQARDEARSEAERDGLTGLSSRRCFDRELLSRTHDAIARGTLALLMIDLDHFKEINDTHGHQAGDEVLRQVASVVRSETRAGVDVVARYGGEEIAVIAPQTSAFCARELAERIRKQVAAHRVVAGAQFISVTVSVGVGMLDDRTEDAPAAAQSLVEDADVRLYQAKHAGRNRIAA